MLISGLGKDSNVHELSCDQLTGAVHTANPLQASVNGGEAFTASMLATNIAGAASTSLAFKTPTVASKKFIFLESEEFYSSGTKTRTDLYETTAAQAAGSDITPLNKNRNSKAVSLMQNVKIGATLDLTGATMLENTMFITDGGRRMAGYILKPNTWYVRLFTNLGASACDLSLHVNWSEQVL